jgi:peptidyl serine alpha-galactosyltransferase
LSGCTELQSQKQKENFQALIAPLSESYSLHFTPDFGVRDNQKYWNKPKGLLDWFERGLGFPERALEYQHDIIMLLDPDMILLRPITHYFNDYNSAWLTTKVTNKVVPGIPIAQAYGFGAEWLASVKGNLTTIVGKLSPTVNLTLVEAAKYYPAGPPYIATSADMYNIALHWVGFLPRVHKIFPHFMAEMYSYSIAAAHLKLKHQLAKGFMASDVAAAHPEGYHFLRNITRREACLPKIPTIQLPYVMHYCQRYAVGRWFFSKYTLREDFFECKSPLMKEPPKNVGEVYDWHIFPNGVENKNYHNVSHHHFIIRHTWMLCLLINSFNEIATEIKMKHCRVEANFQKTHCRVEANFQKTWHFQDVNLFDAER